MLQPRTASPPRRAARGVCATLAATLAAAACSPGAGGAGGAPGGPPGPGGPTGQRGPSPLPTVDTRGVTPARAEMRDAEGRPAGSATFVQTPHGVLVTADLTGLTPGVHAMHFHDVGRCEPPFTTAGAHYNPLFRSHGARSRNGYHAGDLPNISAPSGGTVHVEQITRDVTLAAGVGTLFDLDGTSLMIHSTADDYQSDPGGNSGTRVACGVLVRDSTVGRPPATAAPPPNPL